MEEKHSVYINKARGGEFPVPNIIGHLLTKP